MNVGSTLHDRREGAATGRREWGSTFRRVRGLPGALRERLAWLAGYRRTHPLGYRLLAYIVLFSSALALVTTAVQLLTDYRVDAREIRSRLGQIERSYDGPIANSLWTFDEAQIEIEMQGILALPDVKYVEIDTDFGKRYASGAVPASHAVTREVPLVYRDAKRTSHVGSLKVVASMEGVYQRLRDRVVVILITNAVKNFLIAVFILIVFQRLVTRHLGTMAKYARRLDLDNLDRPLQLHRPARRGKAADELDQVAAAVNEMRLSLIADMAERRRAEASLRVSQERLGLVLLASGTGVWDWDVVEDKLVWSDRSAEMMGVPGVTELTYERFARMVHPDDRESVGQAVGYALEHGQGYDVEFRVVWPDGSVHWIAARGRASFGADGRPARLSGVAIDIDERKRVERVLKEAKETAESANRAKDQFIAVLSHELRTPLNPVLATVSALEAKGDLPAELREDLDVLRRNVELEARLIDDLLDVTRIARGKIELRREVVDAHDLVRRAVEICQGEAKVKRVAVVAELGAGEHHVRADPARLQQVFWNLLTNAIKFTPVGGTVRVASSSEGGRLRVRVTDTGIGIEPEMLSRVFRPFEQAEQTKGRRFGGLGLGLTIAKSMVDLHGGRLVASSEGKGKGATFEVELATVAAPKSLPIVPPPLPGARQEAERRKILLVEDDADSLRVMSRLLRSLGYAVVPAESVQAALEAAGREHFDLLVSDLGLPDGSGTEVMREVKGRYGVKGLAISGYGTEGDVRESLEAGFQRLLTKPVDFNTLATAVREVTAVG